MRFKFFALTTYFLAIGRASAKDVVLGPSKHSVANTMNFDGSDILVFDTGKRERAISKEPLQVIVTIAGPNKPLVVCSKDQRFGIWVNTESLKIQDAPSFYAVAASAPFEAAITDRQDAIHTVSVARAIKAQRIGPTNPDNAHFTDAVICIKTGEELYHLLKNTVAVDQKMPFRTSIKMPANLTVGHYEA